MNKILIQFGLLIFCFSLIFFSQRGMPLQDVVMKSFIVFISLTIALSVVVLFVLKMINKQETLTSAESKKKWVKKNAYEQHRTLVAIQAKPIANLKEANHS